jgi:DNA-binding sugar fermentation-stimulating protein
LLLGPEDDEARCDVEAESLWGFRRAFARGLKAAAAAGVEVMAWACEVAASGVRIVRPLRWRG